MARKTTQKTALASRIHKLRKGLGLSQDELGERVGIHGRHISRYEHGHVRPRPATLVRLAKAFGVSVETLTDLETPLPPSKITLARDRELAARFEEVSKLPKPQREAVIVLLDALIRNHQLERALGPAVAERLRQVTADEG